MPDEARDISANDYQQLERLLRLQHEALMQDDLGAVEEISKAISAVTRQVLAGGSLPAGPRLQHVQALNKKVVGLLVAKKEMVSADLAASRRKRELNKSYRVDNP